MRWGRAFGRSTRMGVEPARQRSTGYWPSWAEAGLWWRQCMECRESAGWRRWAIDGWRGTAHFCPGSGRQCPSVSVLESSASNRRGWQPAVASLPLWREGCPCRGGRCRPRRVLARLSTSPSRSDAGRHVRRRPGSAAGPRLGCVQSHSAGCARTLLQVRRAHASQRRQRVCPQRCGPGSRLPAIAGCCCRILAGQFQRRLRRRSSRHRPGPARRLVSL